MDRVLERMKKKTSGLYRETGAATKRNRDSELSDIDRANEIQVISIPDDEFGDLTVRDQIAHLAQNMSKFRH